MKEQIAKALWVELKQCLHEFVSEITVCPLLSLGGVERISASGFSYRIKLQDMLRGRKEVVECFLHELLHIWLRHRMEVDGSHIEFEEAIRQRAATLTAEHNEEVWKVLVSLLPTKDIISFLR